MSNRQKKSKDEFVAPFVGAFQYEVLRQILLLKKDAYGVNIRRFLEKKLGKEVHTPQVYAALVRLEKLGLISSSIDKMSSAGRRGRPRRVYTVQAPGQRMIEAGSILSKPVSASGKFSNADKQRPAQA